ncbi:MAG: peptide chain release factor N(5)-glutamine methyltransferase [Gammaproteobacteria bacterium]|nr:peptide chain release factor N(5)-glutamine methyltransferase [Gammaproteobacteria bacterium]
MTDVITIDFAVAEAAEQLASVSESARLEAELLVARAIDMPRSYLFAHPEDILDEAAQERLEASLERRLAGEPMAYITGTKEFWSLELLVSPATLVPRPETELLVEIALREIPRRAAWQVLDLGTGSGAIAVAIASERPLCAVTATDCSAGAVAIARQNVRQLELGNVDCIQGDWTNPVAGRKFDVIASNPPYVCDDDAALESLQAEPLVSLLGGADGLDAYRVLASECKNIIEPGGLLILEHGIDQQEGIADLLATHGWQDIQRHRDYQGNPRAISARGPGGQP